MLKLLRTTLCHELCDGKLRRAAVLFVSGGRGSRRTLAKLGRSFDFPFDALTGERRSASSLLGYFKLAYLFLLQFAFVNASASELFAQNSSLFHRPVAYVAQTGNAGGVSEVLPAPAGQNGVMQPSNTLPNVPSFNSGQQPFASNQFQGGPFPVGENAGLLGLQSSWGYVPPVPARVLKLHDIVSIRIEETSTSLATGNATSRKTTSYDAVLIDWIRLVGLDTIKPAPQSDGNPRVQANQNEVYRGDSTIRTSEAFTRNIAAEIVDIKPNGHIVLDATKVIDENDNSWRYSLTGICRSQDIGPDNVVLRRNLIQSHIKKQDLGHVRDGYSRGWLTKLVARIKPF